MYLREQWQPIARGRAARWLAGACGALVCFWAAQDASAAEEQPGKRVLMVFLEDRQVPANRMLEQAIRSKLQALGGGEIEFYAEYLDANRFASQRHWALFREFLLEKYRARRPDVILSFLNWSFEVPGFPPGELIPGIPIVFMAVAPTPLPVGGLGTNITGIVARPDFQGTLEAVFRLQPDTRRVVVIGGAAGADRFLVTLVEKASQGFAGRAEFEFWTNRPLADLRSAVATLPAHTVLLFAGIFRDASGRALFPAQAVEMLAKTANVPIYVWADSLLGSGAVGGAVVRYDDLGGRAGEVAQRIFQGARTADIPITVVTNGTPLFDWRALRRWGISESLLPPGSVVQYRQLTFWEQYRWRIVGVLVFCGLQTALVIGLIINRAKRLQGEAEATLIADISSKFVNLPASEVDREIMDAQRRICELLDLDLLILWQLSGEAPDSFSATHFYSAQQGPTSPEQLKQEDYPWFKQELVAGRIASFASLEELSAAAARDRESFCQLGTKSNLSLPLVVGGGPLIGAFCLNATRAERDWPAALVKRLQLLAQVFTNALARKRADRALRESEVRLRVVADLAGLGCYEINYAETSSFADDRFGEICGMPSGQQPGQQRMQFWIEHLHPDDRPRVLEERQKMYAGKAERYDVEYRYLHPTQGQKWIHHLGCVTARDAAGRVIHIYGVVADITDRKQAEQELQRLRLHLWHADRVAQTGAITASLAHELNQPLTAILSNAQAGLRFMDAGNPDLGEIRAILADIAHDDKRAGAVISGLRNMLRRKETRRERINLAHTIEEVLALVHSELVGQQIELRLRLEPDSLVLADKGQVQQVILNLAMNAAQAMQGQPAGQRRLELTSTQTSEGEAMVAVRDSGPGIPQDQQEKLFEGFWTTKHEGLGIGLPISRSIVESHGGRLSFANNPDQGATFSFTLPLAMPAGPTSPRAISAAGPVAL